MKFCDECGSIMLPGQDEERTGNDIEGNEQSKAVEVKQYVCSSDDCGFKIRIEHESMTTTRGERREGQGN